MKTIIILSLAALFVILSQIALSVVPCYPDFENIEWEGPAYGSSQYSSTPCGCDCDISFEFYFRTIEEPFQWYDLQITNIVLVGDGCISCDFDCILEKCMRTIWQYYSGYMNFPVNEGGCDTRYRASLASCWKQELVPLMKILDDEEYQVNWSPCAVEEGCCLAEYEICWDTSGNITSIDEITGTYPAVDCPEQCAHRCEALKIDMTYEKKPELENINSDRSVITLLIPNPSQNKSTMYLQSSENGVVLIQLLDMMGKQISLYNINKNSYSIEIPLDISKLTDGTYFYRIFIDDVYSGFGKFIVRK